MILNSTQLVILIVSRNPKAMLSKFLLVFAFLHICMNTTQGELTFVHFSFENELILMTLSI